MHATMRYIEKLNQYFGYGICIARFDFVTDYLDFIEYFSQEAGATWCSDKPFKKKVKPTKKPAKKGR
jgi:hypothetical protein